MFTFSQMKMNKKSDELAAQFNEKGNQNLKQKQYLDALVNYNKALCYSLSSAKLSVVHANRSKVFFENKQYELALNNIQISRELDPSSEKYSHLSSSYRKCMRAIRGNQQWLRNPKPPPSIEEDPLQLIKLSYPENPKIPFIVNNVNLRQDKDGDKTETLLYASEPMKAGDIIGIEKSMINLITDEDRYKRCCWCASVNKLNLLPCLKTPYLMFCSMKCRTETYQKMPDSQLNTLVDDSNGSNSLIFTGKFKDYLKSGHLFDLNLSSSKKYNDDLKRMLVFSNVKKTENGQEPYTKIFHFTYHKKLHNYGYSFIGSLLTHSCDPNVAIICVDNKFVFYVTRPIAKNEPLEICFGIEYFYVPRLMRSQNLYKLCGIICNCDACLKDYPVFIANREKEIQPITQNSINLIVSSLNHYFDFINTKGFTTEKTKELCVAHDLIWQLMQEFSHYATYGFFGTMN